MSQMLRVFTEQISSPFIFKSMYTEIPKSHPLLEHEHLLCADSLSFKIFALVQHLY